MDHEISRFFVNEDERRPTFFFRLNPSWWSRVYEYPWAANFIAQPDVCLDAACGISHPFKFYLADHCQEVYALDIDSRILSVAAIKKDVINDFGEDEVEKINNNKYFNNLKYIKAPLTKIPCSDRKFDKIYCLSVLEHINDWSGRWAFLNILPWSKKIKPDAFYKTLQEFKRVLKDDGLIVLTFDFPNINLTKFFQLVKKCGLEFAGEYSFTLPPGAISNPTNDLYCFRAVLKKAL